MHHVQAPSKRPTSLSVIGWAWIIIGAFSAMSALMAVIMWSFMFPDDALQELSAAPDAPEDLDAFMGLFMLPFRHMELIAILQVSFAVVAVISGAALLKLKPWGRTATEILSWTTLAFIVGYGIFWSYLVLQLTQIAAVVPETSEAIGISFGGFGIVMIVFGVFIMAVMAVPFGLMIKHLRGSAIRAAISENRDA